MQSNNPVFARSEGFNGKPSMDSGFSLPPLEGRMTMDTVVEKTAITLGLVIASAAVTWFMIGDLYASLWQWAVPSLVWF